MLAATRAAAARLAPVVAHSRHPIRSGVATVVSRRFASSGLSKEDVTSRILNVVKNFQNVDPAKVSASSHFIKDLGLDSLDTVEVFFFLNSIHENFTLATVELKTARTLELKTLSCLPCLCISTFPIRIDDVFRTQVVMALEDEFAIEIPDADAEKIFTVSSAIDFVAAHPQAK